MYKNQSAGGSDKALAIGVSPARKLYDELDGIRSGLYEVNAILESCLNSFRGATPKPLEKGSEGEDTIDNALDTIKRSLADALDSANTLRVRIR